MIPKKITKSDIEIANTSFFSLDNYVKKYFDIIKKEQLTNVPIRVTIKNRDSYKNKFIEHRFSTYKDEGYNENEIIKLEIKKVDKLPYFNDRFEILKDWYKKELTNLDKIPNTESTTKNPTQTELTFDPNQFDENGIKLFNYLVENYIDLSKSSGLRKRLTNVWHFMKHDNLKSDIYKFHFTKKEYIEYIFKRFKTEITNTDKTHNKYSKTDLPQLKNHVLAFESLNKS